MWLILSANDLIKPNPGLMFWTLLTFIVVLVVLKRKAFGPIQAAIDARKAQIQSDVDAAENARKEAQEALAEYRQALADSRREATKIIDEARRVADEQRKRDVAQIEEEKTRLLQRANEEIQAETRRSLQAIRDQLAELTLLTTEKVVRRQLDEAEQRRLIDEALADVDFQQFVGAEGAAAPEDAE